MGRDVGFERRGMVGCREYGRGCFLSSLAAGAWQGGVEGIYSFTEDPTDLHLRLTGRSGVKLHSNNGIHS